MMKFSGLNLMSKVLPITLLALSSLNSSLPARADFADLSSTNLSGLTYTNTGESITTTPFGEAAGNGNVNNPSTETEQNLTLYLPRTVAMVINTHTPGLSPIYPTFGTVRVGLSRTSITADSARLQSNISDAEFLIGGLISSNTDAVILNYDTTTTLTHSLGASHGEMNVDFRCLHLANTTTCSNGYIFNTSSGSPMQVFSYSTGVVGFRLIGDIRSSSVDRSADRAGQYNGSITITASTQ
jgi:hypothetical protein